MREVNDGVKSFLKTKEKTVFVDVYRKMIKKNGKFKGDFFIEDKLHMNEEGYAIWQKAIKPYLLKD